MPNRHFSSGDYRFGYQGSENDNEMTGNTGSHITTYFREFDTRLGRTWSPDPVVDPWQSPYNNMDNNPVFFNDPFGDDVEYKNIFARIAVGLTRFFSKSYNAGFKARRDDHSAVYNLGFKNGAPTIRQANAIFNGYHKNGKLAYNVDFSLGGFGLKDGFNLNLGIKIDIDKKGILPHTVRETQGKYMKDDGKSVTVTQEAKRLVPNTDFIIDANNVPDDIKATTDDGTVIYNSTLVGVGTNYTGVKDVMNSVKRNTGHASSITVTGTSNFNWPNTTPNHRGTYYTNFTITYTKYRMAIPLIKITMSKK